MKTYCAEVATGRSGQCEGEKAKRRKLVRAKVKDLLEAVCKLCNVVVVNASELVRDDCMKPTSSHGWVRLGERNDGNDVCSAGKNTKHETFVRLERSDVGVDLQLFVSPTLSRLSGGAYGLGGGRAKELSEGV